MTTTTPAPTGADTDRMVAVHTMFRRERRLAGAAVRAVATGDTRQTARTADHLTLQLELLHHHTPEDQLMWPLLLERVPEKLAPVVHLIESQHEAIGVLMEGGRAAAAVARERRPRGREPAGRPARPSLRAPRRAPRRRGAAPPADRRAHHNGRRVGPHGRERPQPQPAPGRPPHLRHDRSGRRRGDDRLGRVAPLSTARWPTMGRARLDRGDMAVLLSGRGCRQSLLVLRDVHGEGGADPLEPLEQAHREEDELQARLAERDAVITGDVEGKSVQGNA